MFGRVFYDVLAVDDEARGGTRHVDGDALGVGAGHAFHEGGVVRGGDRADFRAADLVYGAKLLILQRGLQLLRQAALGPAPPLPLQTLH